MVIIDCEVYRNYFLLAAKNIETGKIAYVEKFNDSDTNAKAILGIMNQYRTVSFNGLGYDLLIIAHALSGASNDSIKRLSDYIIKGRNPPWRVRDEWLIELPQAWDHIDLIDVAPGRSSLKIYGGRLNAPRLQDLPIEPSAIISEAQRKGLKAYCVNDLDITERLYGALAKQVELRVLMGKKYGMDLRSKSDAQIAETVIKSELERKTGKQYKRRDLDMQTFRYRNPKIISFESPHLQEVFRKILAQDFTLGGNGSVVMPQWLRDETIKIGAAEYQMGIGGLHSCEKSQYVKADEATKLISYDVASYYPNIILQQRLAPESLGVPFLSVYGSILERRMVAKRNGDKVASDTLKIAVNGSFGKLGSKYSFLYAPELLIQTTVTGQLALLMLIERLEAAGIPVVSANTDGVICTCPAGLEDEAGAIAFEWMLDTSYTLEREDFSSVASRDINNYVAVGTDGRVKGKGVFTSTGLAKNPNTPIVYSAVARTVATGDPLEQTILGCKDISQFAVVRRVNGGAVWRETPLGRAVRFYYSNDVMQNECIHYATNGNRVPKSAGARPMMDLPEVFPSDVNHAVYIAEAEKILKAVGYA